MSSWCYTEIGISVTDDDLVLKQQYMDCLGLLTIDGDTYNHERCSAAGYERDRFLFEEAKKEDDMIFGEDEDFESIPDNLNDIFFLLNLLFPHTYLYCQHYSGTSVTTENECEEYLFDPKKKKLTKRASGDGFIDIAHEGDSIGKENVPEYCTVKYQVTDEDIYYSPQEFAERCRKKKQGNLENDFDDDYVSFNWNGKKTDPINSTIPSQELIRTIIEQSKEKGYTELTALLLEKCKDFYTVSSEQDSIDSLEDDDENDDDFGELQVTCDVSLREEIISFFIEDFTKRWNEALQRIQEKTEDHSIPDGTGLPFDISFTDYGFLIVMNSLFNTVVSLEEQFFENPSSDDTIRQALSNLKAHYSNLEYEGYLFFDDGGVWDTNDW